jgi:hypothetical protein
MENISQNSSFEEESDVPNKFKDTAEILIDHNETETESDINQMIEPPTYKDTHFYALLLFFDVVNGVFRKKDHMREAYEKIMFFR